MLEWRNGNIPFNAFHDDMMIFHIFLKKMLTKYMLYTEYVSQHHNISKHQFTFPMYIGKNAKPSLLTFLLFIARVLHL